jgi:hypothetical protein
MVHKYSENTSGWVIADIHVDLILKAKSSDSAYIDCQQIIGSFSCEKFFQCLYSDAVWRLHLSKSLPGWRRRRRIKRILSSNASHLHLFEHGPARNVVVTVTATLMTMDECLFPLQLESLDCVELVGILCQSAVGRASF